jgi:hypothetical protein
MKLTSHIAAAAVALLLTSRVAQTQIAVLSSAVAEHDARPGETYEAQLLLRNTSSEPQEARLYQTDFFFAADGRSIYGPPGATPRSNAKWVTLSQTTVTIPPGVTIAVAYTVAVPAGGPALKGSYWSAVMVEPIQHDAALSTRNGGPVRGKMGLDTRLRYAIQVATHLGATGTSRVAFDSVHTLKRVGGERDFRFDFVNTGERALRLAFTLELYASDGKLVAKLAQQRGLLYPGTSARQLFELGKLATGEYKVVLVADGGGDEVFGGQYTLRF